MRLKFFGGIQLAKVNKENIPEFLIDSGYVL